MLNLKNLIENHEDWLTDRVVQYAKEKSYTEYSSTLREAWRISICGLSQPLIKFIESAQSSHKSHEAAIKEATDFGVSQGLKHRSLGIGLGNFVGLLKLYRNAYLDLVIEKENHTNQRLKLQNLVLELFDSLEVGLLMAWDTSSNTDKLTELQNKNCALSNEKNRYLTVFESMAEPAILLNKAGEPTHVNSAAYRLLLGETEPGAGYYGELENPLLRGLVANVLKSEGALPGPVTLETPDGVRDFSVSIQQMLDISNKFAGQVIILQDITDYLLAIDAAQAADRAKSVFLTTISHEIRTPINSILGLTGLLENEGFPTSTQKHLRSIRASGEMLSALIENVLGLSKAETNALQTIKRDFNLTELCAALFQVLELEKSDQKLTLVKRFDPDVPLQLHGDGHKLRHILLNLLSNALKYTERGTVTLSVSVESPKSANKPTLRFEVIDTGIGVRDAEVEGLFEPFSQGAHTNSIVGGRGSGLGLAISKHLVEFLGGQVTYHPNPAGGSTFGFDLEFDLAKQPTSLPKDAKGHTILVVEDDLVNAIVIEGYLKELGNNVTVANSYLEAIVALDAANFDVVITDYRLGEKAGMDVARVVQKISRHKGMITPVIVVSAEIPQNISHRLQKTDVSLFLEKPFSRYELANALSSVGHALNKKSDGQPVNPAPYIAVKDLNQLLTDLGFIRCQAVVRSYQSNMPNLVSGMRMRLDEGNFPEVSELAHQLISASGFVGARSLVQTANELKALSKKADREATQAKFAELLFESEFTIQDLDAFWSKIEATHSG